MSDWEIDRQAQRQLLPIRLSPIGIDDWSAVRYVHRIAFERLVSPYLDPNEIELFQARISGPEYTEDLMRENLTGAWLDTELAGTAGWQPADDHGTTARITSVFVLPVFTGLGIGAQLLADAEARAEMAGFTSFSVRATPNAVGFFGALGYDISSHGISHVLANQDVPITFMRKSNAGPAVAEPGPPVIPTQD
ncbi:MAG: GNAT family N-acetyltransferase [Hyphomicrobiaceae bacterium]